jgi:hypothetical protein
MKKRQEIINQIIFVLLLIFIVLLLWGYGAGWLGASADVNAPTGQGNFMTGVINGVKKLQNLPLFQEERELPFVI